MTEKRLRPKYVTFRVDETKAEEFKQGEMPSVTSAPMLSTDPNDVDSPFVLMPRKDPAAYYALLNYAQVCEAELGAEIRLWLDKIVEAPPVFGTQGLRNRVAMKKRQMDLFE